MLVTHDMSAGRALLPPRDAARRRRDRAIGDPREVGRRYIERNFERFHAPRPRARRRRRASAAAREIVDVWVEDARRRAGRARSRTASSCALHAMIEVARAVRDADRRLLGRRRGRRRAMLATRARRPRPADSAAGERVAAHRARREHASRTAATTSALARESGSGERSIVALGPRHRVRRLRRRPRRRPGRVRTTRSRAWSRAAAERHHRERRTRRGAAEMRGPSAYGGSWRRFFEPDLAARGHRVQARYFGSALGYLWSLMRPLLFFGVLYVVFSRCCGSAATSATTPSCCCSNIVLFRFFSEATGKAVRVGGGPREPRAQDAVPAHGDPAVDRAHLARSTCC